MESMRTRGQARRHQTRQQATADTQSSPSDGGLATRTRSGRRVAKAPERSPSIPRSTTPSVVTAAPKTGRATPVPIDTAGPSTEGATSGDKPWLRSEQIGSVLFPVPANLAGKTCAVSSLMAFMVSLFSDQMIGDLRKRECPGWFLEGEGDEQERDINAAWERLRNSFCDYQQMLRSPGLEPQQPSDRLRDFLEALYIFGVLVRHKDSQILEVLPFSVEITSPDVTGFVEDALSAESVPQIEVGELVSALCSALGVMGDKEDEAGSRTGADPWNNVITRKIGYRYEVGQIGDRKIYGESPVENDEPSLFIEVPLRSGAGDYRPSSLQEYLEHKLLSTESEGRCISQADAHQAFNDMSARIAGDQTLSAFEKRQLQNDLKALRSRPWDTNALHPQVSKTRFGVTKGNDGVWLRLNIFQRNERSYLEEEDFYEYGRVPEPPEELRILECTIPQTMKEFFFQRTSGKGSDMIYQVLPQEHGIACRLSHDIYQTFDLPVATLRPIHRTDNEGKTITTMTLNDEVVLALFNAMECDQNVEDYSAASVQEAIDNQVPYGMAIVVDALVGNRDVASSRLAIVAQDDGSGGQERILCRTDFSSCMGYSRTFGDAREFGPDASDDLEYLKATMKVSDEHIRDGMGLLSNFSNHIIAQLMVRNSLVPEGQSELFDVLCRRRDSLLALAQYQPERGAYADIPLEPSVQARNKSHLEAVTAVTASDGSFELPEVYCHGQKQKYMADICAMVCHLGESMGHGHFIEVHEVAGEWFVSDDLVDGQASLISDYLRRYKMEHLIDKDRPNGWHTLKSMLRGDSRYITPVLVYGRRCGVPPRPEWEPSFRKKRLTSWGKSIQEKKQPLQSRKRAMPRLCPVFEGVGSEGDKGASPKARIKKFW